MFWSPAGPVLSPVLLIRLVGEKPGLPEQSALVLVSSHTSGLNQLKHTDTSGTMSGQKLKHFWRKR